jgi:hypothetical protein
MAWVLQPVDKQHKRVLDHRISQNTSARPRSGSNSCPAKSADNTLGRIYTALLTALVLLLVAQWDKVGISGRMLGKGLHILLPGCSCIGIVSERGG